MSFLPLYYQILGLEASNKVLIRLYQKLMLNKEPEVKELHAEIDSRIQLHLDFKEELSNCIESNFRNKTGFIETLATFTLPGLLKGSSKCRLFTTKPTWENCNEIEKENIKKYYNILYTPGLTNAVTELLLEQKSQVEYFLIGNAT